MELKGTIHKIFDTQTFSSGFQKREFVLKTSEQYSQEILIELLGDKIDILDNFKEGEEAIVSINIRGKSYTNAQGQTKWFNSLNAWAILKANPINTSGKVPQATAEQAFGGSENPFADDDSDDIPF